MLEIHQLRQLIAIAENETLTTAAESLYISHSTLSRTIKRIEKELGVKLFHHTKNKIFLNENGRVAVEEARKVISQLELMEKRVHECDMSQRTISIASCAPSPLWVLVPVLADHFPDMSIHSALQDVDFLTDELLAQKYQLIVIARKPTGESIFCQKWTDEQLFFSVPVHHPKAFAQQLTFQDIGEETILLSSNIGCWKHICEQYLPNAHFIVQDNRADYMKLASTTVLPVFKTNLSRQYYDAEDRRVNIPMTGDGTVATYYCCCLKHNMDKFAAVFDSINQLQM